MLKRCFCTSPLRLKIDIKLGSIGDISKWQVPSPKSASMKDPSKDRPSSSPNRFRALHERNNSHQNKPRNNNSDYNRHDRGQFSKGGIRQPYRRSEPSRPIFEIYTGSERAQMALKGLIQKAHSVSSNYKINYVDPATKEFLTVTLHSLVNKLDLSKEGIKILPAQGDGYPIIRVIPVADMVQTYVDELAAAKQKELLEMGSSRALRAASSRAQAERKKSATKILTLSWSISVSDLLNQKKNEIEKRLSKDEKLVIFVGEKGSLSSARKNAEREEILAKHLKASDTNWDRMGEDENLLEMKKREMIFGKLQEVLQELGCKMETSGSLDARMMIKLSLQNKLVNKTDNEKELSPRELKKLKKFEKAKERSQAKERKLNEEDIDSLYSLKIED